MTIQAGTAGSSARRTLSSGGFMWATDPLSVSCTVSLSTAPGAMTMPEPRPCRPMAVTLGPATAATRAVLDAMRRAPDVRAAVRAVDMACAAELVSPERVARYAEPRPGWVGMPRVAQALDLCDERSRSPLETDGRLVWRLDAGLPRPRVNVPVFSRQGKLLGIADLLDEEAGLVVELDGADHAGARRRSEDAGREAGLRNHRLEVERVTGYDLHHRPALVGRLHQARRRALWLPVHHRPWTLEPPPWWEPELPLDKRGEG